MGEGVGLAWKWRARITLCAEALLLLVGTVLLCTHQYRTQNEQSGPLSLRSTLLHSSLIPFHRKLICNGAEGHNNKASALQARSGFPMSGCAPAT